MQSTKIILQPLYLKLTLKLIIWYVPIHIYSHSLIAMVVFEYESNVSWCVRAGEPQPGQCCELIDSSFVVLLESMLNSIVLRSHCNIHIIYLLTSQLHIVLSSVFPSMFVLGRFIFFLSSPVEYQQIIDRLQT